MSGVWTHFCVGCGRPFRGTRCQIACGACHALGRDRARGRCLDCETRLPFARGRGRGTAQNKGALFCEDCRHERKLAANRRYKQFFRTNYLKRDWLRERALAEGTVVTPDPIEDFP